MYTHWYSLYIKTSYPQGSDGFINVRDVELKNVTSKQTP